MQSNDDHYCRVIQKFWRKYIQRRSIVNNLKKLLKRQNVASELLSTETVYLSAITTALKV